MKNILSVVSLLSLVLVSCGGPVVVTDAGVTVDSGVATAPTCASYCTAIMAACNGANEQYGSAAACLGSCSAFMQGTTGATSGNTLACRAYHTGVAATDAASATTHCSHAGPTGDGACSANNCEGFCTIAVAKCATQFATAAACTTACMGFATNTAKYSTATKSGNSFACRMYHMSVAATDAASATTHCDHTTTASAAGTCQ